MFGPEQWTVADVVSPDEPSQLFIDALESSEVNVMEKDPEISLFDPVKFTKRLAVLQKRIIMLMSSTAIERYEHFEETYPDIVQRVPQRMIASYLGITPEALSKVKSQKKKNQKH